MTTHTIVVGAHAHTDHAVLRTAARFAVQLSARLVIVQVDDSRVAADPADVTGQGATVPLDPDDFGDAPIDTSAINAAAAQLRTETQVTIEVRALAGDPARALARVAADTHAMMIVVGSSTNGLAAGLEAAFRGSPTSFLMHRQPVPVLVVPISKGRS